MITNIIIIMKTSNNISIIITIIPSIIIKLFMRAIEEPRVRACLAFTILGVITKVRQVEVKTKTKTSVIFKVKIGQIGQIGPEL